MSGLAPRFLGRTLALSWGLCAIVLVAMRAGGSAATLPHWVLLAAACAPSLAAASLMPRPALRRRLGLRLHPPSFAVLVLAIALGIGLSLSLDGPAPPSSAYWPLALVAPFGEELGWRGLLLPALLERRGPLLAGLLTGAAWAAWHLPAFFLPGAMGGQMPGWWVLGTVSLSVVMAFLFVRSGGSAVTAGLLPHGIVNLLGLVGLWSYTPVQSLSLLAGAALLAWAGRGRPGRGDAGGDEARGGS